MWPVLARAALRALRPMARPPWCSETAQPSTRRECQSITAHRKACPPGIATYVMSAHHTPDRDAPPPDHAAGRDTSGASHPECSSADGTKSPHGPSHGLKLFTQYGPDGTSGSSFYTGLDTFFANWARQDSVAAGERLSAMLNEPWADTAILGYARAIAETDPDAASQWLSRIKDQTIRSGSNR